MAPKRELKTQSSGRVRGAYKKRLPQLKLRTRLIISYLAPILAIIIIGLFSYAMSKKEITDITTDSAKDVISGQAAFFNMLEGIVRSQGLQFLTNEDIKTSLKPDFKNIDVMDQIDITRRINSMMTSLSSSNEYVRNYSIIGENKGIYSNTAISVRNIDELKKIPLFDSFISGKDNGIWIGDKSAISALYGGTAPAGGTSLAYVMKFVDTYSAKTLGVIIIEVDPKVVEGMIERMGVAHGVIHIISHEGFDSAVSFDEGDLSDMTASYAFSANPVFAEFRQSEEKAVMKTYDNKIIMLEKTGKNNVVIGIEIPLKALNAAANRILAITIGVVAASVLISGLIALMISNNLSATVKKIVAAAKAAASGDLQQRLSSDRNDEFGVLINSIGSMMDSMRHLILEAADIAGRVFESASLVSSSSEHIVKVAGDITTAVGEISAGATSQAQDAEEGVKKSSLLAESIGVVAESTRQIEQVSGSTFDLTKNGLSSIRELEEKAGQTNKIIREVRDDIDELSNRSKKIASIVKVITGVADRTRLLSLNASIEAARAGEMGLGFAVVAEEVKLLAEQTAESARDIAVIVRENEEHTEVTVKKADSAEDIISEQNDALEKAVHSFNEISNSMEMLVEKVESIKASTLEMERHKDQVFNAIQNISSVSEETAATTQEVTASAEQQMADMKAFRQNAEQLESEARRLQDAIKVFKV